MNIDKLIKSVIVFAVVISVLGCSNVQDMHANAEDRMVPVWEQTVSKSEFKINLLWAKPIQKGRLPTIIVHPGMGQNLEDMRGVLIDLTAQGYIAVAVDYERRINNEWTNAAMPLREKGEIDFLMSEVTKNPWVDSANIGLLGFSLGGAHSLKISENNPLIKTVIVYYPMTDFVSWAKSFEDHIILSFVVRRIKSSYLNESTHHTDATHLDLVSKYSAINFTNNIQASVLVIHGDDDKIAPLGYSKRFVESLQQNGNTNSKLMVVNDGSHGFNFKRTKKSLNSWATSLDWMDKHLIAASETEQMLVSNLDPNNSVVY